MYLITGYQFTSEKNRKSRCFGINFYPQNHLKGDHYPLQFSYNGRVHVLVL